jgi:hypothetical protein
LIDFSAPSNGYIANGEEILLERRSRERLLVASLPMQTYPFDIDPKTDEPFLRLPHPHERIIITSPRAGYADAVVEILNEPEVHPFVGAPYPHTMKDATNYIQLVRQKTEEVWSEIITQGTGSKRDFGNCPVRSIIEIQPDGRWMYIGDFGLDRWRAREIRDPEERARVAEINLKRPVGEPDIIWSVGCKPFKLHY